jgi:methyl-accepting chemotaxis protein
MRVNKFKMTTQLYGAFAVVILIFTLITVYQIVGMQRLAKLQDENIRRSDDKILVTVIQRDLEERYGMVSDLIINRKIGEFKKETAEDKGKAMKDLGHLREIADTEKERELNGKLSVAYNKYSDIIENQLLPFIIKGGNADSPNVARLDEEIVKAREAAMLSLEEISGSIKNKSIEADRICHGIRQQTTAISVFLSILGIIIASCCAFIIAGSIKRQLGGEPFYAAGIVRNVANGDLSINIDLITNDNYSLLYYLKNMVDKLKDVMASVKSTSDNLASASRELSAGSEQMSRGLTEQSGRSSQIATAANEMSQTIVDVAKNSSNIASSAAETLKVADNGKDIVGKSVKEVKAIAETVNESAKLISSLGERSKQIGEIVNVIKDIADQTNLLALNAAIEAARAGEQGRGFAVVADEVRKLAERTAKATSEISKMIGAIQDEMEKAVISMDDGTKRVETGVEFAARAGEELTKIVGSVSGLQTMVQQIAAATEEMSTASEQISGDIETIVNVTKETATSSEQVSEASSDFARLAGNLRDIVGIFKV